MMTTIFEGKHVVVLDRDDWEYVERKKGKEAVAVIAETDAGERAACGRRRGAPEPRQLVRRAIEQMREHAAFEIGRSRRCSRSGSKSISLTARTRC